VCVRVCACLCVCVCVCVCVRVRTRACEVSKKRVYKTVHNLKIHNLCIKWSSPSTPPPVSGQAVPTRLYQPYLPNHSTVLGSELYWRTRFLCVHVCNESRQNAQWVAPKSFGTSPAKLDGTDTKTSVLPSDGVAGALN